ARGAGGPRPRPRADRDAQGDACQRPSRESARLAPQRAPRPRRRERVPARLQDGPRGHRVEATRLALPVRPDEGLAEVQEPGGAGGEAGWRRGLGQTEMIDLAALASLFFEASKEWREPKVVQFDRLEDAEEEQVVRDLKAKGHERQWVRGHRLRQLKQKGWEPIVER